MGGKKTSRDFWKKLKGFGLKTQRIGSRLLHLAPQKVIKNTACLIFLHESTGYSTTTSCGNSFKVSPPPWVPGIPHDGSSSGVQIVKSLKYSDHTIPCVKEVDVGQLGVRLHQRHRQNGFVCIQSLWQIHATIKHTSMVKFTSNI